LAKAFGVQLLGLEFKCQWSLAKLPLCRLIKIAARVVDVAACINIWMPQLAPNALLPIACWRLCCGRAVPGAEKSSRKDPALPTSRPPIHCRVRSGKCSTVINSTGYLQSMRGPSKKR
jgi:hypothetical protein